MPNYCKLVIEGDLSTAEFLIAAEEITVLQRLMEGGCSFVDRSSTSHLTIVISGSIHPNDLEAVKNPLEKLHNLGCGIHAYDALNEMTRIEFASNTILYRPARSKARTDEPAPDRWRVAPAETRLAGPPRRPARPAAKTALLVAALFIAAFLYYKTSAKDPGMSGQGSGVGRTTSTVALPETSGAIPFASTMATRSAPPPERAAPATVPPLTAPSRFIEFDRGTKTFVRDIDPARMSGTFKSNYARLTRMLNEYRSAHTYSMDDLFVCVDMANDICNMIKTRGMDADLVVGRVDEDTSGLSDWEYLSTMNHAWVIAEIEPGSWVPVEATGGFIVPTADPKYEFYTHGVRFNRSADFKTFIELRHRDTEVCREANAMAERFNERFAGKPESRDSIAYKGAFERQKQECDGIRESLLKPVRLGRF